MIKNGVGVGVGNKNVHNFDNGIFRFCHETILRKCGLGCEPKHFQHFIMIELRVSV